MRDDQRRVFLELRLDELEIVGDGDALALGPVVRLDDVYLGVSIVLAY